MFSATVGCFDPLAIATYVDFDVIVNNAQSRSDVRSMIVHVTERNEIQIPTSALSYLASPKNTLLAFIFPKITVI